MRRRGAQLSTDVKQRAENLMIVDLMRNDIGRIAEIGSVSVTDLFTVETFQTLHQMTSGIRATLKADIGMAELLRGIFPPGSVIGAPKIRAMELIRGLETEPRGVYCGAIGHVRRRAARCSTWRSAQRWCSATPPARWGSAPASSGIRKAQGIAECLLKMKFLTDPVKRFDLIETMLLDKPGASSLLERHMDRCARQRTISPSPSTGSDAAALAETVKGKAGRLRVRLLLVEGGQSR